MAGISRSSRAFRDRRGLRPAIRQGASKYVSKSNLVHSLPVGDITSADIQPDLLRDRDGPRPPDRDQTFPWPPSS